MLTRRLTSEEVNIAMRDYPRPIRREPVIRIRHVFLAAFVTGLLSALLIMDPVAKLAGCAG